MNLQEPLGKGLRNISVPPLPSVTMPKPQDIPPTWTTSVIRVGNFIFIREAIFIRVVYPSLNWNIGKYQLSYIWDEVLFNTPDLKLKLTFTITPVLYYAIGFSGTTALTEPG